MRSWEEDRIDQLTEQRNNYYARLHESRREIERLSAQVQAVRDLHQPMTWDSTVDRRVVRDGRPQRTLCSNCTGADWPCPTVAALGDD